MRNMSNRYIDGTYIKDNPTWHEEDSSYKAKIIWKILDKNNVTPLTFCEVGCGAGGILKYLQERFSENAIFKGYDISPDAIRVAKQKENDRLKFYNQDFLNSSEVFDLVIVADVIEHIEDYFKFLRGIKNRGAHVVFNVPLDAYALAVIDGKTISFARKGIGHLHIFTKDMVFSIMEETGFHIIDWAYNMDNKVGPTLKSRTSYYPSKIAVKMNSDFLVRIFGGPSLTILAK